MKIIGVLALVGGMLLPMHGQGVKWMTIEEAQRKNKVQPRKILVDVYTDWCGWCKKMDRDTYTNPAIVKIINENFYPVKFNAEQRASVVFKGKTYNFLAQGGRGVHEFAYMLLNGQMGYPATAFIDGNLQVLGAVPGYRDAQGMEALLYYILEEKYKAGITLQQYEGEYIKNQNRKTSVPPTP